MQHCLLVLACWFFWAVWPLSTAPQGHRPNTVLIGSQSAVWPVMGANRGQVRVVLSGGPERAVGFVIDRFVV